MDEFYNILFVFCIAGVIPVLGFWIAYLYDAIGIKTEEILDLREQRQELREANQDLFADLDTLWKKYDQIVASTQVSRRGLQYRLGGRPVLQADGRLNKESKVVLRDSGVKHR